MKRRIQLNAGDRFGKLTFLSWVSHSTPRKAIFRCDCGKEKEIIAFNVVKGRTKSCGCNVHKHKDVTIGDTFGKWKVVETGLSKKVGSRTFSACKCICSCESHTERILTINNLIRGLSKSCGCKIKDTIRSKQLSHKPRLCYGYRYVYCPNHPHALKNCANAGYVMEHRLVMERHIGRYLSKDEVVHHKDRNRLNNDISNLQLMTIAEHSRLHSWEDCAKKRCVVCDKEIPASRRSNKCCECVKKSKEERIKRKPSKERLAELLEHSSYAVIGRNCGVTGSCVKKWAKKYGIPLRNRRTKISHLEF